MIEESKDFDITWFLLSLISWILGKMLLEFIVIKLQGRLDPSFTFHLFGMVVFPCIFANAIQGLLLKKRYGINLLWWLGSTLICALVATITSQTQPSYIMPIANSFLQWVLLSKAFEHIHWWVFFNLLLPYCLYVLHFMTIVANPGFIIQDGKNLILYGFMAVIFALTTTIAFNQLKSRT